MKKLLSMALMLISMGAFAQWDQNKGIDEDTGETVYNPYTASIDDDGIYDDALFSYWPQFDEFAVLDGGSWKEEWVTISISVDYSETWIIKANRYDPEDEGSVTFKLSPMLVNLLKKGKKVKINNLEFDLDGFAEVYDVAKANTRKLNFN